MRILQISNDFAGSKVHSNLVSALAKSGIEQIVYCPIRDVRVLESKPQSDSVIYSLCIKKWYRYVYHYKSLKLFSDLDKRVDISSCDLIHAHTLFSDGVLAYKAHKKYGTPYSVAIRNTDLNGFIRLLRHTYCTGRKILLNAEKIYFISAGAQKMFESTSFAKPIMEKIKNKIVLRPNGIDDYWHKHISTVPSTGHNILYIGDFSANKNVTRLAKAVLRLRKEEGFEDLRLVLVGGGVKLGEKSPDNEIKQLIHTNPGALDFLGKIYDKDALLKVMRSCSMFAMASIHETFGLVYLEALSQNLPVVYTKGQGIDGLFDKSIGIAVNPYSDEEIYCAVKDILTHKQSYSNSHVNFADFEWDNIAAKYVEDYNEILKERIIRSQR